MQSNAHFADGELLTLIVEPDEEQTKYFINISDLALFADGSGVVEGILKKFKGGKLEIRGQKKRRRLGWHCKND